MQGRLYTSTNSMRLSLQKTSFIACLPLLSLLWIWNHALEGCFFDKEHEDAIYIYQGIWITELHVVFKDRKLLTFHATHGP